MTKQSKEVNKYGVRGGLAVATKKAVDNFNNLTDEQFERLEKLKKYLRWHRISHKPINKKILPLFYDLGLFVYDESIEFISLKDPDSLHLVWGDGIAWLMTLRVESKYREYKKPDLATTLQLLTAVLQGCEVYGADFWYAKGFTRELITHLVQFRREKGEVTKMEDVGSDAKLELVG